MDRATILRAGAALVAAATFIGSGGFVLAHPKNPAAPLQPPAPEQVALRSPAWGSVPPRLPTSTPARSAAPPRITLAPGVKATELPGITYTHVS